MSSLLLAIALETFRIFGSAGAEAQITSPAAYGSNVADLTTFAEAVGKERRWKARVKVRSDASDQAADRVRANEAFVQVNVKPWLDVTAGRVIEKWGTAYAWNPTAFVSPLKDPTDPGDRRSAYRGIDMIKADVFVKDTSVALYALERGAFAARAYRLVRETDVSLNVRHDRSGTAAGASVARVIGDALELHGEVAIRQASVAAVAGAQYTFPNHVNAVFEVYHDGVASSRDFAFVRLDWPFAENRTSVELIAIANVHDGSTIARVTASHKLRPNLSVYAIETELIGGGRTVFMPLDRSTNLGMRYSF